MQRDQMYSIGQVSSICNISIQTLRYYDKIKLVQPSRVDSHTNYRFYSNYDVLRIKVVQDMKRLSFSLEQIAEALEYAGLERIVPMLEERHRQIQRDIRSLEEVSKSLEMRMTQIEYLQKINDRFGADADVFLELKSLPLRHVTSIRTTGVCTMEASVVWFSRLFEKVEQHSLKIDGYIMTIYHENLETFDRSHCDLEYCIPISQTPDFNEVRAIDCGEYLTALYSGIPNEDSCKRAYRMMVEWMKTHRYEECGPAVEQYLVDMTRITQPEEFIIELQIPVRSLLTL